MQNIFIATTIIAALTALINAAGVVIAWIAKIRWSNEYKAVVQQTIDAKDDIVKVKEAQIETLKASKEEAIKNKDYLIDVLKIELDNLRQFSPMKLREYYLSTNEQLEEIIKDVESKLEEKERENEELQVREGLESQRRTQLEGEIRQLKENINNYDSMSIGVDTTLSTLDSYISGKAETEVKEDIKRKLNEFSNRRRRQHLIRRFL